MKKKNLNESENPALNKTVARQCIDDYIGKHFRFLENYIDGGYEEYVRDNLKKITHKKVYGVERIREEYKKIKSPYLLEQQVLEDCEKTLEYVRLYCAQRQGAWRSCGLSSTHFQIITSHRMTPSTCYKLGRLLN